MAAHMDILRHLVKNTEHKPAARAFGADGVKKIMRAADNLTGKSVITGFWGGHIVRRRVKE